MSRKCKVETSGNGAVCRHLPYDDVGTCYLGCTAVFAVFCVLLPALDHPAENFPNTLAHGGKSTAKPFISDIGSLLSEGTEWAHSVVVSVPFLQFRTGVVKAHEPLRVQIFGWSRL